MDPSYRSTYGQSSTRGHTGGSHYRRNRKHYHIGGILITLVVLVLVGSCTYVRSIKTGTVTFTVTRLDDQSTSKGHQYLVFTDHGVYKDGDNLWHGKFNSSDLFAFLQQGHRYRCTYTGFRVPLFSSYRNLIGCKHA